MAARHISISVSARSPVMWHTPRKSGSTAFESFISTRYVTKEHIQLATQDEESLIQRSISHWQRFQRPVFIAESLTEGDFGVYKVPFCLEQGVLQQIELKNVAAHGLASKDGEVITFFSFSRVPEPLNSKHAYVLELIVPHLHAVLMRIVGRLNGQGLPRKLRKGKSAKHAITERERDVLKWMQAGKTNSEIAAILKISSMTVKNHVHNILKKLGVENRNNACAKASQLGLFNV